MSTQLLPIQTEIGEVRIELCQVLHKVSPPMNRPRNLTALLQWCLLLTLVFWGANVQAQSESDTGTWLGLFARGEFDSAKDDVDDSRLRWWFDGHARFFQNTDGFGQSIVRPGLGYALSDTTTLWAGYGWIRTSPASGPIIDEHRIWQQVTWSETYQPWSIGSRSRLEQRFLEADAGTGWRFRQLVSARRALDSAPEFSLVAWDELFVHLNDTDWGAHRGFDQNRLFLGFGWKPRSGRQSRVEIGYLNQYINRAGGQDLTNHLISVNFYPSF